MTKTPFNMGFNHVAPGYYGFMSNYDGYKGFDFSDMYSLEVGQSTTWMWHHVDEGYYNILHGDGEAFTAATANYYHGHGVGYIFSPTKETFTLTSGDFASAWDLSQNVYFTTFKGSAVKAVVEINLSLYGQTIHFANYGAAFKDITKVEIYSTWKGHVGSSDGAGYQIVMDNIRGFWNGPKPVAHPHIAHAILAGHGGSAALGAGSHGVNSALHGTGFHSALTSLESSFGHHVSAGGLTAEFALPTIDHFGT